MVLGAHPAPRPRLHTWAQGMLGVGAILGLEHAT